MIIKVSFEKTNESYPKHTQTVLNGVVHAILGKGNKYHDAFSDYSISSIQGAKMTKDGTIRFPNCAPYFRVASNNSEFICDFVKGLSTNLRNENVKFYGLMIDGFDFSDFHNYNNYDVVKTISPILLKVNDRMLTPFDTDNWLEILVEQTKKKLARAGIVDDTFGMEILYKDSMKMRWVTVGKVNNPATTCCTFKAYGKKETRYALCNLGLGNSTGCGFGSIDVCQNNFEKRVASDCCTERCTD